jgi:hypothetical protein
MTNTNPLSDTTTEQIQASAAELVDEVLRRGMSVDELCNQTGVSDQDVLWRLLGP